MEYNKPLRSLKDTKQSVSRSAYRRDVGALLQSTRHKGLRRCFLRDESGCNQHRSKTTTLSTSYVFGYGRILSRSVNLQRFPANPERPPERRARFAGRPSLGNRFHAVRTSLQQSLPDKPRRLLAPEIRGQLTQSLHRQ